MAEILSHNAGVESICVVKADAYGHTTGICAPVLASVGAKRFAVANIAEACALKSTLTRAGYTDFSVLILGRTDPDYAPLIRENAFVQCVYSPEYAKELSLASDGKIQVHIKADTGMNRLGFSASCPEDIESAAESIIDASRLENIEITGLFTHFARSDERTPEGENATRVQFKLFSELDLALERQGLYIPFKHCCNSAAALYYPEFACDGVRLGVALYGAGECSHCVTGLLPVMRFETRVTHIHTVKRGEGIGYGGAFTAEKDMRVATLSVGYADGFSRDYKNAVVGIYTANGVFDAHVVGRVCMDQFMVDIEDFPVKVGDRAVIFGDTPDRIRRLAESAGTIDYECLCAVSARVPRISE